MLFRKPPYFMSNKKWYRFDEEKHRYVLTEDAPPKAVESYNKFYEMLESQYLYEDGNERTSDEPGRG